MCFSGRTNMRMAVRRTRMLGHSRQETFRIDGCLPQMLMDTEEIRSKPHAAGAQRPVTRLHAGISACLAGHFGAFIPP
jgi:hypothetical protein